LSHCLESKVSSKPVVEPCSVKVDGVNDMSLPLRAKRCNFGIKRNGCGRHVTARG